MQKTSIRFFENKPVRGIWDDENSKWLFSATDIVEVLNITSNSKNYWNKLKKRNIEIFGSVIKKKLKANDQKFYFSDVIDEVQIKLLFNLLQKKKSSEVLKWLVNLETSIDEKSKTKSIWTFWK
ncbi:BRO family protein [Mycoplasma struthionis]|uniref:BRO family protein n=1 Tax=Mycoplasma struthionis TaxID=538220 RepID=UPI001C9455ED|nr:BRO family protein [Mycoplasma struthionis]